MDFTGKHALVTGAAGGIGAAIVSKLARGGRAGCGGRPRRVRRRGRGAPAGRSLGSRLCRWLAAGRGGRAWRARYSRQQRRRDHPRPGDRDLGCRLVAVGRRECRGALPRLPRRDPDHGGGGRRGHRQHGLLLGAAARAEPRGLLHDQGGDRIPHAMHGHGSRPPGHPHQRGLPERGEHADAARRLCQARLRSGHGGGRTGQVRAPWPDRRARGHRRRGSLPRLGRRRATCAASLVEVNGGKPVA